jgi:hypothetical protein
MGRYEGHDACTFCGITLFDVPLKKVAMTTPKRYKNRRGVLQGNGSDHEESTH